MVVPRAAGLLLILGLAGCGWIWPEDGAYDPFRCDPACENDKVCRSGRCVPLFDSGQDAAFDDAAVDATDQDASTADGGDLSPDVVGPAKPCGNGERDNNEQCDPKLPIDPATESCSKLASHSAGLVSCSDACTYNTAGCYTLGSPKGQLLTNLAGDQTEPVVASDGTSYLVVWSHKYSTLTQSIMAQRVTPGGVPTGSQIKICYRGTGARGKPKVVFVKAVKRYAVVWEEDPGNGQQNLNLALVDTAGRVVEGANCTNPAPNRTSQRSSPSLATDGTQLLLVWSEEIDGTAGADVGALAVTPGGATPPVLLTVAGGAGVQDHPAAVHNGGHFLVAWDHTPAGSTSGYGDIHMARVSNAGKLLDPKPVPIAASATLNQRYPAVATDGSNTLLIWREQNTKGDSGLRAGRVSRTAKLLSSVAINGAAGVLDARGAVVFDGSRFLAVWSTSAGSSAIRGLTASRISRSGERLPAQPMAISTQFAVGMQTSPSMGRSTTGTMLVWQTANTTTRIYTTLFK